MALRFFEKPCGVWGKLTLRFYQHGILLREDLDDNIVVNGGMVQWLQRLHGATLVKGVDRVEVGDGGCEETALYTPISFTATDTALRTSINLSANLQADPVVNVGAKTITFVAVVASALADPSDFHYTPRVISEIALKTASPDNVVVALRAFKSQIFEPTSSIELEATWTLGLV